MTLSTTKIIRSRKALFLSSVAMLMAFSSPALAREEKMTVSVGAQATGAALLELAKETGVQIIFKPSVVTKLRSAELKGKMTVDEAVAHLLKGTKLSAERVSKQTIVVNKTPSQKQSHNAASATMTLASLEVSGQQQVASAIESDNNAPEETKDDYDEIVVTGSRLLRPNADSPIPVTSLGREEIGLSGAFNIGELISELPSLGLGSSRISNSGNIAQAALGTNLLNLRSLGTSRTLVVVNGRRHIGSVAGSTSVDVGSIPTALIERVDISTGGASVAYGADAIAGVVNMILKKNFEGIQLDASGGISDKSDGEYGSFALTVGTNFADDRANIVFNASYNKSAGIAGLDRDWLAAQQYLVTNPLNTGPDDGIAQRALISNGRITAGNNFGILNAFSGFQQVTFTADGTPKYFDPGLETNDTWNSGGDGWNLGESQVLANPLERLTLFARMNYELNDNINFFLEGKYYSVNGSSPGQAQFTQELIRPDNAFLPQGNAEITDVFSQPAPFGGVYLSRLDTDYSVPFYEVSRKNYRVVSGIEGTIPGTDMFFDLFMQYGKTTEKLATNNLKNALRVFYAVDAVVDTTGATGVAPGAAACRVTLNAALGAGSTDPNVLDCLPLNLFGLNQADQGAIDYVRINTLDHRSLKQFVGGGSIGGDLFDMPGDAGSVNFVSGFEYRSERSSSVPDAIYADGSLGDFPEVSGVYNVIEGFAEVRVPLITGKKFAEVLAVEGGVRVSHYNTVGNTVAWRAGAEWAPIEDIRFRAGYARAVRAPNIGELFSPQQVGATAIDDPCDSGRVGLGPNPALRLANCTADLATLGLDPASFNDFAGNQTIIGGGNPDLQEETTKTITLGAVFTPTAIPGLLLTVDYYTVKLDGAIASPSVSQIINDCYDRFDSTANEFCALFNRDTTPGISFGQIENLVLTTLNIDSFEVSGVDFEASYRFELSKTDDLGNLNLRVVGSYLSKLNTLPASDAANVDKSAGELTNPKWRINFNAIYNKGPFTFSWLMRYIGGSVIDVQVENPVEHSDPFGVSPTTIHDLQFRYALEQGSGRYDFYIGINNVFDSTPNPLTRQFTVSASSALYDPIGRFIYGGISAKF